MWFYAGRTLLDYQRPLSNWHWSVAMLRLAAACLLTLGLAFAVAIQITILKGDGGGAHPGALPALLLAVWSGWIALALYPGILFALILLFFIPDVSQEFTAIFCLLWAFAHLTPGKGAPTGGPIYGALVVAVTAAVFTGFVYLPAYAGPPWIAWIAREILGSLFVLLLLQRCRWSAHLTLTTARSVRRALFTGVALSCLAAVALRPDDIAVSGIAGAFLAFGLVPPLFLPLFVVPLKVTWLRSQPVKHIPAPRGQE